MKKRTCHDEIRRKVYECNDSCDAHSTRVSIAKISCVGHEPRLTGVLFSGLVELSTIFSEKALVAKVDDGIYLSRLISVESKRSSLENTVVFMSDERLNSSFVVDWYASRLLKI
jgi:hypothetical protein